MFQMRMVIIAIGLAFAGLTAAAETANCKPANEKSGLPNFGCVTDTIYRGGQPVSDGFSKLQEMGVGLVINFRDEKSETTSEKLQVESLGMKYIGIPWNGWDEPSSTQVVEFLDSIRVNPQTKIFVHCKRGADRTGVMIAAYRIAVQHESVAEAVSEMYKFHYDWLLLPQLKRYVESLPGLLQDDRRFSTYNSSR